MKKSLLIDRKCRQDNWIISSYKCNSRSNNRSNKWLILIHSIRINRRFRLIIMIKSNDLKIIKRRLVSKNTKTCSTNNWKWKTISKCMEIWAVLKKHLTEMNLKPSSRMTHINMLWFQGFNMPSMKIAQDNIKVQNHLSKNSMKNREFFSQLACTEWEDQLMQMFLKIRILLHFPNIHTITQWLQEITTTIWIQLIEWFQTQIICQ